MVGTICGENQARIRLMEKSGDSCCIHLKNFWEKFGQVLDVVVERKKIWFFDPYFPCGFRGADSFSYDTPYKEPCHPSPYFLIRPPMMKYRPPGGVPDGE